MPITLEQDDPAAALLLSFDEVSDAVRLTLAYSVELADIAEVVGGAVRNVYEDLIHTNRDDLAAFITEAEPYAKAGMDDAADLAAAYISEVSGTALTATEVVAVPELDWIQPFLRTWHQLDVGDLYLDAKASGATVAEQLGHDAAFDAASRRMDEARKQLGIRGYRRVVTAKACEWCRVVATQFYRSEKTATFGHHGCRCIVVPVFNNTIDTAKRINKARLSELKAEGALDRATASRLRSRERERAQRAAAMATRP